MQTKNHTLQISQKQRPQPAHNRAGGGQRTEITKNQGDKIYGMHDYDKKWAGGGSRMDVAKNQGG